MKEPNKFWPLLYLCRVFPVSNQEISEHNMGLKGVMLIKAFLHPRDVPLLSKQTLQCFEILVVFETCSLHRRTAKNWAQKAPSCHPRLADFQKPIIKILRTIIFILISRTCYCKQQSWYIHCAEIKQRKGKIRRGNGLPQLAAESSLRSSWQVVIQESLQHY